MKSTSCSNALVCLVINDKSKIIYLKKIKLFFLTVLLCTVLHKQSLTFPMTFWYQWDEFNCPKDVKIHVYQAYNFP